MTISNRSVNRAWLSDIKPRCFCFVCYADVHESQLRQCDVDTLPQAGFSLWINTSYLSWLWWKWGEIMHEGHLSVPLEDLIRGLSRGRRLAQEQTSSPTQREATVHRGINSFQKAVGGKWRNTHTHNAYWCFEFNSWRQGTEDDWIQSSPTMLYSYSVCVTVTDCHIFMQKQINKTQTERQVIYFFIIEIDFS